MVLLRYGYLQGAYAAPTPEGIKANIDHACAARDRLALAGWSVHCPHANTAHMENLIPGADQGLFYTMDLTMLKVCDVIYMLHGWQYSKGACIELQAATEWGLRIIYEKDGIV